MSFAKASSAWYKHLAPCDMGKRWSFLWWKEMTVRCTVFAITGTTSLKLCRPVLNNIPGLEDGSFRKGPWQYWAASFLMVTPTYSLLLLTIGTMFGRYVYFQRIFCRMWRRFGMQKPAEGFTRLVHDWPKYLN